MTQDLIDQLRGLLAKATHGPWRMDHGSISAHIHQVDGLHGLASCVIGHDKWHDPKSSEGVKNAALIVAAVNALPGLLDTIATLTKERDEAREDVRLWKREAANRSEGMVSLNLDRAAMGVENIILAERATAAEAERDAARAALKPFQVSIRPEIPDDEVIDTIAHTAGDYRRAAAGGVSGRVEALTAALEQAAADFEDIAQLALKQIDDGEEHGSRVWRIALQDIAKEADDDRQDARAAVGGGA